MRTNQSGCPRSVARPLVAVLALFMASLPVFAGIEVRADRISTEHGVHWLHLTLWNCSSTPVKVSTPVAPWGGDALFVTLYGADRVQRRHWALAKSPEQVQPTEIIVQPGGHAEGKTALLFRPFVKGSKEKGPFVLFWSYNTGYLGENPERQLSGTINMGIGGDEQPAQGSPCSSPPSLGPSGK